MASGGGRDCFLQCASDRDPTRSDKRENESRPVKDAEERSTARGKREYVPPHRVRGRHDRPAKRGPCGRGRGEERRKKPPGVNALQLESTTRVRGGGRRASDQPLRAFGEDGVVDEEKTPSARKREVHAVSRVREEKRKTERRGGRETEGRGVRKEKREAERRGVREGEGRGVRGKDVEDASMDLLRRSEEKATYSIRVWRDGRAVYRDVEPNVSSVWFRYQGVLECGMERAVRESLGQRVWRCIHYPVIELLRKPGQRNGWYITT